MFANFELYRGGWVSADVKRRHTRSGTGCLPCRKRKKKCDENWPVCTRCIKYNSRGNCFPASPSALASTESRASPKSVHSPRSTQSFLSNSPQFAESISSQKDTTSLPPSLQIGPEGKDHLPSCSLSDLFLIFNPASHALDLGPESSIISLTMPLIARSPAVFHAMASCSSIFLSQEQPSWHSVAIQHHCKTLRSLAVELTDQNFSDPDSVASSMAVVMMLHLFEKFDPSSRTARCTHVFAAQEIFYTAFSSHPPQSALGTLVLEAFVYRIAINSTFHPELLKTYNYLEILTTLYGRSPVLQGSEIEPFRCSLWLGLPPSLFVCIYKISFLRCKVPLTGDHWFEAVGLSQRLKSFDSSRPVETAFDTTTPQDEVNTAMHYVRRLYVAAARLILLKIMDPEVEATDPQVQELLSIALREMLLFNSNTPVLMYPLAVLGTAAVHGQSRELVISQLNRMRRLSGLREVQSVCDFLNTAWGKADEVVELDRARPDHLPPQLDIWLDHTQLKFVTI